MGAFALVMTYLFVLNACLGFANVLGIGNQQFITAQNANIATVESMGACGTNSTAGTITCSPNLAAAGGSIATLSTFGDFLWSLGQLLVVIPMVALLPAYFMVQDFYMPISLAAVYQVVFMVLLVFYINTLVSGRYQNELN